MFTKLIDALKATRRTIVFTEGPDARILEAADRLIKDDLMNVILIGNVDEVKAAAEKGGFDIAKAEIIDPATYAGMDEMVQKMVELRKGKMSEEDCRKALAKGNYFGTMLVKMGKADALLGGATYSTADTVRPALQLVKTKKGAHLVSSSFILFRKDKDGNDEKYCMGDCAINIDYPDTLDKTTGEVVFSGAQKLEHSFVGLQELEREIGGPRHEAGKERREDRCACIVVGREPERFPSGAVVLFRIAPEAAQSREERPELHGNPLGLRSRAHREAFAREERVGKMRSQLLKHPLRRGGAHGEVVGRGGKRPGFHERKEEFERIGVDGCRFLHGCRFEN